MSFNPSTHLIQLPRKQKNPSTGQWEVTLTEYLPVAARVAWFRESFPHGIIDTEMISLDWEKGVAIFKATVTDGEGGSATAYAHEVRSAFPDFLEKANTRSVGRALALLGWGTLTAADDLSEGDHVADAPVTTTTAAPDAAHETPGMSHPLPVGEDGTPGAATPRATNGHSTAPEHPTESHLAALRNLAVTECQEPVDVYEERLRTMMKIPKQASVAPRLLTRTMSMAQYMELFAYYRRLEAQLAKGKEATHGTVTEEAPASKSTPAPTVDGPPAVPSPATVSSSAAPDLTDAAERDRVRLRAEVASWNLRISDKEREHVIQHNSYRKARALLWKTRVDAPASTPIEAAAD